MLINQLAYAAVPMPMTQNSADVLEAVLHAEYPEVTRWQLSPVSAVHHKRRPKLFAKLTGQGEIRREGNLFLVQLSPSLPKAGYRAVGYQAVSVAMEYLPLHEVLRRDSITSSERDFMSLGCVPLSGDLEGTKWRVRHPVKPDEVLCREDVEVQPAIARNQAVTIHCDRGVVAVAAPGVALSDGERGQIIEVRRSGRYRIMRATVVEQGEVDACI